MQEFTEEYYDVLPIFMTSEQIVGEIDKLLSFFKGEKNTSLEIAAYGLLQLIYRQHDTY